MILQRVSDANVIFDQEETSLRLQQAQRKLSEPRGSKNAKCQIQRPKLRGYWAKRHTRSNCRMGENDRFHPDLRRRYGCWRSYAKYA